MQVRYLGAVLDAEMSMTPQVKATCRAANFFLSNLRRIRNHLPQDAAENAIHALVTSRLDCNNILLNGQTKRNISNLQRIQNNAARVVTGTKKFEHITPALKELHWLKVTERVQYKTCLVAWKAVNGNVADYIGDLLARPPPSGYNTRISDTRLHVPITRRVTMGDRAFSSSAPRAWNSLPNHVCDKRSLPLFKSALKTHLFSKSFPES